MKPSQSQNKPDNFDTQRMCYSSTVRIAFERSMRTMDTLTNNKNNKNKSNQNENEVSVTESETHFKDRYHSVATTLSVEESEAARNYYLLIVSNNSLSYTKMKTYINNDLVKPLLKQKNVNLQSTLIFSNLNLSEICQSISSKSNENEKENLNATCLNYFDESKYTLSDIGNDSNNCNINEFEYLRYKIGISTEKIESICWNSNKNNNLLCVGRLNGCDIQIDDSCIDVSRIHLFFVKIKNKLMILDGWSCSGTCVLSASSSKNKNNINITHKNDSNNKKTWSSLQHELKSPCIAKVNLSDNKKNNANSQTQGKSARVANIGMLDKHKKRGRKLRHNLMKSIPYNRNIFGFDTNETIHLKLGVSTDLIINPKVCIICMDNARTVRLNSCGHSVFCKTCATNYSKEQQQDGLKFQCPICRKNASIHDLNFVNGIESYCKVTDQVKK